MITPNDIQTILLKYLGEYKAYEATQEIVQKLQEHGAIDNIMFTLDSLRRNARICLSFGDREDIKKLVDAVWLNTDATSDLYKQLCDIQSDVRDGAREHKARHSAIVSELIQLRVTLKQVADLWKVPSLNSALEVFDFTMDQFPLVLYALTTEQYQEAIHLDNSQHTHEESIWYMKRQLAVQMGTADKRLLKHADAYKDDK